MTCVKAKLNTDVGVSYYYYSETEILCNQSSLHQEPSVNNLCTVSSLLVFPITLLYHSKHRSNIGKLLIVPSSSNTIVRVLVGAVLRLDFLHY